MNDESILRKAAAGIAAAIAARDVDTLSSALAPGFLHRGDGPSVVEKDAFLEAVRSIPGEIVFVRLERVDVDVAADAAMLTGVQHARVKVDGETVDDRRAFADFFVRHDGAWKLRAAVDLAAPLGD